MKSLRSFSERLPLLATLLLPLLLLTTSCNRFNANGGLAPWGILLLILDILAIFNVFGKSWDIGKKIIWAAIIFFFPFGGLLIYYIFGRNS
ncbi:PLD nuclease N-terminal domain-containing protein [Hymenobacter sp. BRD67]|uniref:PLD nuclease N-terminal domain-containing protein n=1 Tax=Hymenobacter sp. BRD67 TaxID=2675877 RepID=UPI0015643369|nr:PLD nuclease N-terminal domain-containing protein [Hymenobacter sp. BRD67]QKG54104.1 PLDc_N domain-containing protein [Hymenobacter sp. BRD67]